MSVNYIGVFFIIVALTCVIIAIWKTSWIKEFCKYVAKDEMPIWLSVVFAVSAALGTYYLAPVINEDFEFQKNRSTHLISTVNDLNKSVIDLSVATRKFDDSLFYGNSDLRQKRGVLLDKIAELQWRLVDAQVIIQRVKPNDNSITRLSASLNKLQNAVLDAKLPKDQEKVAEAHVGTVQSAKDCMISLYDAAKIN